jgi:polyhydroxybutyrate depolymerase
MLGRFWSAVVLFLVLAPAPCMAGPVGIDVGGVQRTYLIAGPGGGGPHPLILMLHGLGGNALGVAQASHLAQLAPQAGFIAVFPNGLAHQWNHYPPGQVTPQALQRAQQAGTVVPDDVGFLKAIIDRLVQNGRVDPRRVYIAGFSNGGFMALRMACDDAQQFAAIALISTGMPDPMGATCQPGARLPALIEKGTADAHIPFAGGQIIDHEFDAWSAPRLNAFFVALDDCVASDVQRAPYPNNGMFQIEHAVWQKCTHGPVEFYKVIGGQHTLFQFPAPAITLWDFFRTHSR